MSANVEKVNMEGQIRYNRPPMQARVHLINFLRKFTFISLFYLMPLHFLRLGFDGWQIGAIISAAAAAPFVVAFPTGWINDRLSISGVVRCGLIAQGALIAAASAIRSFPLMAAAFLGLGMANNVLDVSIQSLFYKDETEMDQNRKYGTYTLFMGLGPAFGVVAGGALAKAADFGTLLLVFGGATFLILFAAGRFGGQKFHAVSLSDYRRDVLRGKPLLFAAFVFVLALHWAVEGTVYSPYLDRVFGLGPMATSAYIGGGLLALALAASAAGRIRFNPRLNTRLMLGAMFASGAGLILMLFRPVGLSFAFRVLHDGSDGVMGVMIAVFISRLFEKRTIGGSAGVLLSVQILGQMAGSLVFAPLGFRAGLAIPFVVAGAMLVLNALYGALIFRRIEY